MTIWRYEAGERINIRDYNWFCLISSLYPNRLQLCISPHKSVIMEQNEDAKMPITGQVEKITNEDLVSESEEKKLIRRMDIRLVGTCGLLLCISLMDRINLSQAAIAG